MGKAVGRRLGDGDGSALGIIVGRDVGSRVGASDGDVVGDNVGAPVGNKVGAPVGGSVGMGEGSGDGADAATTTSSIAILLSGPEPVSATNLMRVIELATASSARFHPSPWSPESFHTSVHNLFELLCVWSARLPMSAPHIAYQNEI